MMTVFNSRDHPLETPCKGYGFKDFASLSNRKVVLKNEEILGWLPEFADEFDDDDESEEGSKGDTANSHVRQKLKDLMVFNVQGADMFNTFIANVGLEEIPLGGSSFTWCHKSATKMSKLDRVIRIFTELMGGNKGLLNNASRSCWRDINNEVQKLKRSSLMSPPLILKTSVAALEEESSSLQFKDLNGPCSFRSCLKSVSLIDKSGLFLEGSGEFSVASIRRLLYVQRLFDGGF
ncbi:hypothetical protein Tco_0550561 [Tanacetum coccineum]